MRVRSQHLLSAAHLLAVFLSVGASWALRTSPALAQVPETRPISETPAPFVFGTLSCPDPKAVQQAVLSLIPRERHALLARGVRVELEDLGDSYRVSVWKGESSVKKSYADPARDCDGRVRFAAVFAVLTLMPPELGLEQVESPAAEPPATPPPAPKPVPKPARAQSPPLPPLAHVELSALYASAPAILDAPNSNSLGAELRVALGRGALSGTLSVAYLGRAKFDSNGVEADVTRLPLSVGVRWRSDVDTWTLDADLGLLVVAQRVRATNLLLESGRSSVDVGARTGLQIARRIGRHVAPFVAAFAWLSPAPAEVSVLPQGEIGNLPYLWLGGALGVSFGL